MTRVFFGLILILTAFAQATIFPTIRVLGGMGPDLVLVLILVWSSLHGPREGMVWAFALGLLLDLLTLDRLGTNALALIPVAMIGGAATSRRLFHSGLIIPMVAVVVATLVHQFVLVSVSALGGLHYPLLVSVKFGVLIALLNVLVVPPLYLFVMVTEYLGVGRAARA